ncbi:site-specific DNA-cytosine methylase [Salinibacter ruber]|nr:site-specific DNA-cytosine methylase [Salinibacter ruber]
MARDNGLDIHTADVTEVDPSWYERVDVLHASPPCPNFSVAKTGGEETDEDVSLAEATVRFADEIEPQLFTLENVWGYRKSRSWKLIREHLQRNGYDWNAWKINAANYGVPQTRKRMIVAARKDGPRPKKPPATHAENPSSGGLFGGELNEWVGWYEAIDDLISDLPETELADWQKERLPDELTNKTTLCQDNSGLPTWSLEKEPACVVTKQTGGNVNRAIICDTQPNARGDNREGQEPTKTVAADPAGGVPRAVLVQNENEWSPVQKGKDPSPSVSGTGGGVNSPRAVLVDGKPANFDGDLQSIENGPMVTVSANTPKHPPRAVLVPGGNASSFVTRGDGEPSRTISNTERVGNRDRAVMGRRVVQMTPRALARFQTFPDWYDLPGSKSLACRIIGNAVPPLAMTKWIEHWTG